MAILRCQLIAVSKALVGIIAMGSGLWLMSTKVLAVGLVGVVMLFVGWSILDNTIQKSKWRDIG